MEESPATPSSLLERVSPASAISLALGLLILNFLVQGTLSAWVGDEVLAIGLASALCFIALPAVLWSRVGAGATTALTMREDVGDGALRGTEVAWIMAIAAGMLLPLDRLGEWNQWILEAPESYFELQRKLLPDTAMETALAYLGLGILVPVGEEIVFRGIAQQAVRRLVGPWMASLLTGLLFALLHIEPWFLVPLCLTGFLLGIVYEITDTLWAPVLLHILYNCSVLTLWIGADGEDLPGSPWLLWLGSALGVALVLQALRGLSDLRRDRAEPTSPKY